MTITSLLVLGGARSGKSRYAQARAEASGLRCVYVATGQALDDEMRARISRHKADRGERWSTIEVPLDLAACIADEARPDTVLLIDCLTLWASNIMFAERDLDQDIRRLESAMADAQGPIIFVANEVGLGIVPDNPLARRFRDAAGSINQAVAGASASVIFIAAGLPLHLK